MYNYLFRLQSVVLNMFVCISGLAKMVFYLVCGLYFKKAKLFTLIENINDNNLTMISGLLKSSLNKLHGDKIVLIILMVLMTGSTASQY